MTVYERLARPVLYRLGGGDAETAHEWTLRWMARMPFARILRQTYGRLPMCLEREVFGVRFPGPVGLAAGMDKNGVALRGWRAVGFGFAEVGTVTAHPQPGNERPRLFRLTASEAVINRMGFNNLGSASLAERLDSYGDLGYPLGISIGKSKVTPLSDAVEDYVTSLRRLHAYGDYFAVNVSSPNTPGLRSLQDAGALAELLAALRHETEVLATGNLIPKPVLVKIAPDLTDAALDELLEVCTDAHVAGVIATNTTVGRTGIAAADEALGAETGGLSGRPLTTVSRRIVERVVKSCDLPVIGVGGILDPDDAVRLMDAGASLVQLYTGLVYRGPGLVRRTNSLLAATERQGAMA